MPESHTFTISPDHPCLEGHFPGRPVVPGVVILDEVLTGWRKVAACPAVTEIVVAKFQRPLNPGEPVEVRYARSADTVRFRCQAGDECIASGRLRLQPA